MTILDIMLWAELSLVAAFVVTLFVCVVLD